MKEIIVLCVITYYPEIISALLTAVVYCLEMQ